MPEMLCTGNQEKLRDSSRNAQDTHNLSVLVLAAIAMVGGGTVAAESAAKSLRMFAVPGGAIGKGRQPFHGQTGYGCLGRLLHARHVLLVQPGPLGQRVIGHDVLLDETADSCADTGLHDPNLGRSAARQ